MTENALAARVICPSNHDGDGNATRVPECQDFRVECETGKSGGGGHYRGDCGSRLKQRRR